MSGSTDVLAHAPEPSGRVRPGWRLPTGVLAEATRALDRASAFAIGTQGGDGAWRVPAQPRILDNAVAAYSLAGVDGAQEARERAVRWLASATVQRHDPLVAAADRWLLGLSTGPGVPALPRLVVHQGPHLRRALYLHALGCAADAPGADPGLLLDHVRAALGADRGAHLKPWQRSLLHAFEAIGHCALGTPLPPDAPDELGRGQSADGAFYGMPMVTGMLHLALTRIAPDHPVTRRCRESLLADQHEDGTWRFLVSEVWDTGLMVRALRGHLRFEQAALAPALGFLASAQREDGGWACAHALDSDNDTTGNTLLALAGTAWAEHVRAGATDYARRHQTPQGLWTTWRSSDDTPVADVVAHMVAGIAAAALPGIDLGPARRWLADLATTGGWESNWYIPLPYGPAEIAPALGHRPGPDAPPPGRGAATALLAAQRPDGGWPRIPDEPYSSPTATGLALTALTTDALDVPETALHRAVRFLIDAQTPDGTWNDRPVMYGPRPFLTVTTPQVHALAARGLNDLLQAARARTGAA
ncbi:prenyltransferase/squalene oxidase repeat-containing protein [Kitasatospora sp. NPDC008050]|uniref:prenyltransferase/squalene oxidase repeat-containing protein n=1 Tax=Kitasatospora sp. NPDC008050 TaxID=3364021 RepID=UPI0036E4D3FF